jgi:hypothetical protein
MAVVDPISGPTAVWTFESLFTGHAESALCSMFNPAPSRVRSLIGLQRSERRGSSAAMLKARLPDSAVPCNGPRTEATMSGRSRLAFSALGSRDSAGRFE